MRRINLSQNLKRDWRRRALLSGLLCFIFICHCQRGQGQDAQMSQSYSSPMFLSPSFTGLSDGGRVGLNYRNQWPGIPDAFVVYSMFVDHYFKDLKSGVGLMLLQDNQGGGVIKTTQVGAGYSYNVQMGDDFFFRPGLTLKYNSTQLDHSKVVMGSQYNVYGQVIEGSDLVHIQDDSYGMVDAAVSVMVYNKDFWFGITADHLTRGNISFSDNYQSLPLIFNSYGGIKWVYQDRVWHGESESLTFNYFFKYQDNFKQLDLGILWNKIPFDLGVWYRGIPGVTSSKGFKINDGLIFLFGFKANDNLKIAYSYDYGLSDLSSVSGGAHELSLQFKFNHNYSWGRKRRTNACIPCPDF